MDKILVTGGSGMLGGAIVRRLRESGLSVIFPSHAELDLKNLDMVRDFLSAGKFDKIFHCAALVGGIQANIEGKTIFLTDNLSIDYNLLSIASQLNIRSLTYIASSCMYPANRQEKLKESDLLSGPLEPTNESYAIAKITGTKFTQAIREQKNLDWMTVVPSNLYGPYDNFNPKTSHLLAAIIFKVLEARNKGDGFIEVWGTGQTRREFTFVGDIASWLVETYVQRVALPPILNLGFGIDFTVAEFYQIALRVLGVESMLKFDETQPDGNSRKLMDSSLARSYGWDPKTDLETGIQQTAAWYEGKVIL